MTERFVSRRRLLAATATMAGLTGLAGCSDAETDDDTTNAGTEGTPSATPVLDRTRTNASEADGTPTDATGDDPVTTADVTTAGSDRTDTPAPPETPDLREADVVGVELEQGGEDYRFSVTLYHDDDGEQLGRRELLHAHSTDPFTRSETISVPDDASCVVVRGHDQTHGYGGRAAAVDLDSGTSRRIDQGPEPRSIEPDECPTE